MRLEELLDISINRLVDDSTGTPYVHLTDDWKPTTSNRSSYGHDIKLSWLLTTAAEALGYPSDLKLKALHWRLVDHVLRDGFNWNRGVSIGRTASGPATEKQKAWWVQAEGLVGLLNAYQLTHEPRYWKAFESRHVMSSHALWIIGMENGLRTIIPITSLGSKTHIWKEPYHQGRACLEIIRRLATISNGNFITHKV